MTGSEGTRAAGPIRAPIALGLLVAALALSGCHGAAPMHPTDIDLETPEKDVVIFEIELEEPADPRSYRDWAQERLGENGGEFANPRFPAIPVYEVLYRFRRDGVVLAEVTFRRSEGGTGPLDHERTVVRATAEEPR